MKNPTPTVAAADADAASFAVADFGYRAVRPEEKPALVREVFDRVARRYDLMNDLMSGGVHRIWKDRLVARLKPRPGMLALDMAGGTGDIAARILQRSPETRVILADINGAMLAVGRDRLLNRGLLRNLDLLTADAERLPLGDRSVDAYTIAFGLRNVTRIDAALGEAWRVLKPGGRFFCLEFSQVTRPALDRLYRAYSFGLVPQIGAVVARDRAAYRYLVESIRRFPAQDALAARIAAAGFGRVGFENFTGGVAALHRAMRL